MKGDSIRRIGVIEFPDLGDVRRLAARKELGKSFGQKEFVQSASQTHSAS
jgi:hypothetical protein